MIPLAPSALAAPAEDYRSYLDQARFYLKKGWRDDAAQQLELAVASEDGALDPEVWMLLARVSYERFDLGRARFAADRALVQSRTPAQTDEARELLSYFDAQFGVVTVRGPQDGSTARLRLSSTSLQLDPDLVGFIRGVADRVGRPVVLPYVLGLPAGTYELDGVPVTVVAGGSSEVSLRGARVDLRSVGVEVAATVLGTVGRRAADLYPAPTAEVGLSIPVGSLDVGGRLAVGAQTHQTPEQVSGGLGLGAGLHAGVVIPGTGPFFVRPAMVLDVTSTPGFGLPCAALSDGTFRCSEGADVQQLLVYAPALGLGANGELTALYQNRRQARSLGFGVRLSAGVRTASVPGKGTVDVDGPRDWTLDPEDRGILVGVGRASLTIRIGL